MTGSYNRVHEQQFLNDEQKQTRSNRSRAAEWRARWFAIAGPLMCWSRAHASSRRICSSSVVATRSPSTEISIDSVDSYKLYTRMERKKRGLTIGWSLSDRKETPGNIDMSNIPSEEPWVNDGYFWVRWARTGVWTTQTSSAWQFQWRRAFQGGTTRHTLK